jgi:hypothetical protein
LVKRFVNFILFFVNFAVKRVTLIFNAQLIEQVLQICIVMIRLLSISMMSLLCF